MSESSKDTAGNGDGKDTLIPGLQQFEQEVGDQLEAVKEGLGVGGRSLAPRQQPAFRRKIDEMVLVGKGAPA